MPGPDGGSKRKARLRVRGGTVAASAKVQRPTRLLKQIRPLCECKTRPMKKQSNTNIVNSRQKATHICLILENQKEKLKTHQVQIEQ